MTKKSLSKFTYDQELHSCPLHHFLRIQKTLVTGYRKRDAGECVMAH